MKQLAYLVAFLLILSSVCATNVSLSIGSCYDYSTTATDDNSVSDLVITEICQSTDSTLGAGEIDWSGSDLNLTALGPITTGIFITQGSIVVDTLVRPDLDAPATLTFYNLPYATEPVLLQDGVDCTTDCENITYDESTGQYVVDVTGFSNYTVTGRKNMTVYTDTTAYLQDRVYQTIDFGATNISYKCVVMIFDGQQHNLLQSNPTRKIDRKDVLSISTDLTLEDNSPEYLGYFKSENGLVNVYYQKNLLIGYEDFVYVAKCHSDTGLEMVYEEIFTPQYWELFKSAPARGVWWNLNADIATWIIISGIIIFLIVWVQVRKFR